MLCGYESCSYWFQRLHLIYIIDLLHHICAPFTRRMFVSHESPKYSSQYNNSDKISHFNASIKCLITFDFLYPSLFRLLTYSWYILCCLVRRHNVWGMLPRFAHVKMQICYYQPITAVSAGHQSKSCSVYEKCEDIFFPEIIFLELNMF